MEGTYFLLVVNFLFHKGGKVISLEGRPTF